MAFCGASEMDGRGENAATRKRKASKDVASKTSWEDTLQEVRDRIEKLTDKDLRPEMIKRNIPGVGKLTKQEKIDAIMCYEKAQSLYQANANERPVPNMTKNCRFRLLNILFSDQHCAQFARVGERPSRLDLDEGKVNENSSFWQAVQQSWSDNEHYNGIINNSPLFSDIDPSESAQYPRDAAKLRNEYLTLSKLYAEALRKFTISGTHENEFFNFCNGNKAVLYLRMHLMIKPNLENVVVTRLDSNSSHDSLEGEEIGTGSSSSSSSQSKENKPQRKFSSPISNQSVSSSSSTTPASSDSHGSRKKIEEQRNCIIDRLATNMEEILHQRKKQRVAVEEDEIQSHLATVAKMTEIIISLQEESQRATGEGKKDVEDEISYYRKKRRELREKTLDFTKK
eukprot:TRINITY_DN6652_c0_g1_i4.p1 TRINITY_DN6652_c0_g1~~TRINITY_DN6652_c0_g1_i4.p1  ORF type:complete len:398 (+),score=98.14 TRINITY_DN6652_c0_g1_i4:94-1287(+)